MKGSRKARSIWAKLALMLIPITIIVIGLESAARLYVWKKYDDPNHGMNWKFMYEPYILTRTNNLLYETVAPKNEQFRVLVIGGSTANLIPKAALEAALTPVIGREVEVINRAQGGYILNQERITLLLHGIQVEPDLLITLNGANDLVTASKTLRPGIAYANDFVQLGVERPVINGMLGLIRNSQFINCVNKLRERRVEGKAHGDVALMTKTVDHCEEALHSMAVIAKGLEIPHYMFLQPYIHLRGNLQDAEKALAETSAYRGEYTAKGLRALHERLQSTPFPDNVYYANAAPAFDAFPDPCFIDEVHLNEKGNHALIAFIVKAITDNGVTLASAASK